MAYTYSTSNLGSSELSQLRLLIGDNNSSASAEFNDAEIGFFNSQRSNLYGAAALACESLAAAYAQKVDKTVGRLRLAANQKFEHYQGLAAKYTTLSASAGGARVYAGGLSVADKLVYESDTDRVTPAFYRGQDDFTASS